MPPPKRLLGVQSRAPRDRGARGVALVGTTTSDFIMIEQLKSLDWLVRSVAFIERVPQSLLDDVKSCIATMLDL
jgi:hypothetical protein